jgi:hypothetical protein
MRAVVPWMGQMRPLLCASNAQMSAGGGSLAADPSDLQRAQVCACHLACSECIKCACAAWPVDGIRILHENGR